VTVIVTVGRGKSPDHVPPQGTTGRGGGGNGTSIGTEMIDETSPHGPRRGSETGIIVGGVRIMPETPGHAPGLWK